MPLIPPVQSVQGSSTTGATLAVVFSPSNIAGHLLIYAWTVNVTGDGVADSQTNTINTDIAQVVHGGGPDGWSHLRSAPNCKAGANTATASGGGSAARTMAIAEYAGIALSSPLDVTVSNTGFGAILGTGVGPSTRTPYSLLVGWNGCGNTTAGPFTPTSAMIERQDINGGVLDGMLADRESVLIAAIVSGATSTGGSSNWACLCAAYKGVIALSIAKSGRRPAPFRPGIAR